MGNDTITVNKNTLWKASVFVLAIALVVVLVVTAGGNTNPSGNAVQQEQQKIVDLDVFVENSDLFPSIGPENAKNVIIEFSDFQCPYCALASGLPEFAQQYASQYPELVGLSEKIRGLVESGDVKFVYVPMSFLGEESVYAAQASLCANKQDKFWEMHDAIFTAHDGKENNGKFTKDNLKILAESISDLDVDAFNECLDNDTTLTDVKKSASFASSVVSGTPSFFVNGEKVSASWSAISSAISA